MSGASIAKKVAKAFGKAGKKLGYNFAVYRSDDYLQPVQDRNIQFNVIAGYTFDYGYAQGPSASFSPMKLFADATLMKEGDILFCEDVGTDKDTPLPCTLTLVAKFDIRAPIVIETNDKLNVSRTVYRDDGDGFGPKGQIVFSDVPCKVLQVGSASSSSLQPAASQLKGATRVYDVWVWFPADKPMEPADSVIFSNGVKGIIQSIELNDLGYKLKILEVA